MTARDRAPPPTAEQCAAIALNELRYRRGEAYREGWLAQFDHMHGITRRRPEPKPELPKRYIPADVAERDARRANAAEEWQALLARLDVMLERAGFAAPVDAIKPLVHVAAEPLDAALAAARRQYEPQLSQAAG